MLWVSKEPQKWKEKKWVDLAVHSTQSLEQLSENYVQNKVSLTCGPQPLRLVRVLPYLTPLDFSVATFGAVTFYECTPAIMIL